MGCTWKGPNLAPEQLMTGAHSHAHMLGCVANISGTISDVTGTAADAMCPIQAACILTFNLAWHVKCLLMAGNPMPEHAIIQATRSPAGGCDARSLQKVRLKKGEEVCVWKPVTPQVQQSLHA